MFPCVCPVIDNEFRHQIAKATVDPQTTMMKFIIRIIVKTAREFGSGEFNWTLHQFSHGFANRVRLLAVCFSLEIFQQGL